MPTILVVEDEVTLAVILERVLTQAGYQVVHVPDGQAALDVLATTRPDLVVTNLHLPVLDDGTLCQRLAADPHVATIPRVVISGGVYAADGLPDGTVFVPKPFALEALLAGIRNLLDAPRTDGQTVVVPPPGLPAA